MKNFIINAFAGLLLLQLFACKKDNSPQPPASAKFKKPSSILYNWEYNGTIWQLKGFMLLDLDHASNKDKSFMVVDVKQVAVGEFRFELKKGPLPIESLASNWPEEVRSVSFGYSNDMTVNAHMRLQAQNTGPVFNYRYDSIHKFSSGIYVYNYLNNPLWAGSMAGKTPQARLGSWVSDANNNAIPKDVIYYFKESAYSSVISPGNGGISLKISDGVDMQYEMWSKVDAALTVEGAIYSHLFFDVDEWKFFSIRDWCPAIYGSPCQKGGLQKVEWISMDKLMDWPEGWGPK
jgi:hypothetical protein